MRLTILGPRVYLSLRTRIGCILKEKWSLLQAPDRRSPVVGGGISVAGGDGSSAAGGAGSSVVGGGTSAASRGVVDGSSAAGDGASVGGDASGAGGGGDGVSPVLVALGADGSRDGSRAWSGEL